MKNKEQQEHFIHNILDSVYLSNHNNVRPCQTDNNHLELPSTSVSTLSW